MGPIPQETADLFTFTKEIFNGKLHFFCIVLPVRLTSSKLEKSCPENMNRVEMGSYLT